MTYEEIKTLEKEIGNLNITAENFCDLRDEYEWKYKISFIDYISDKQLLKIEETSGDYEFDQLNGIIDEIEKRSGIEQPEYDEEEGDENHSRFEKWYWNAIEELAEKTFGRKGELL